MNVVHNNEPLFWIKRAQYERRPNEAWKFEINWMLLCNSNSTIEIFTYYDMYIHIFWFNCNCNDRYQSLFFIICIQIANLFSWFQWIFSHTCAFLRINHSKMAQFISGSQYRTYIKIEIVKNVCLLKVNIISNDCKWNQTFH